MFEPKSTNMAKSIDVLKSFPKSFWTANTMELFERLAWYGMFIMLANYLTGSQETGALGFSQSQKALMMSTLAGLVYFLPILTGAIADRIGYRKVLILAYFILMTGYLALGVFKSFGLIYISFIYLAVGAAFFKPVITATISKTTTDESSSIGFGIFYMIVNVGAFIGPFLGAKLKVISYDYVFYMSAIAISINLMLVVFFFKEPHRIETKPEKLGVILIQALKNILMGMRDWRFMLFLFIIAGFWSMYNQLFYTFPVFIDQWVDLHLFHQKVEAFSPLLASWFGNGDGKIESEMLVNADAFFIVLFQVGVSAFVMRFKPLNSMIAGIFVSSIGIGLTVATNNPFFMLLSIFIFALGEMASSPKIIEYIGKIAPIDKVGLYMGFSYFPHFLGNIFAGILSGPVYERMSDKYYLLNIELNRRNIELPVVSENYSLNDYFTDAAISMQMTNAELREFLFVQYNPSGIWIVFSGIGIGAVIMLFIYDRWIIGKKNDPKNGSSDKLSIT